eukprot:CAMPEP_0194309434 /NCGR_PEP_ID=MMETSP0171-20130528/6415_1 /TAXON_ID=218684 /ORGANISM="Corethron pennatum, Strain L29A3" /LENGTH=71 /DNA_ID=CAMNT_0039062593 /DNA_START=166 /DNA_END=377 /DNA_ORIENTATION=-
MNSTVPAAPSSAFASPLTSSSDSSSSISSLTSSLYSQFSPLESSVIPGGNGLTASIPPPSPKSNKSVRSAA